MQLLQHFKELSLRPKNAEELKGLILKLAIQGKLTSNWRIKNSNIKSASELLDELISEKKILIKDKKIKKEKPLSKVKKEELIVNLPDSWETVRLGEIGDWGAGSTPLRSNSSFYGGEINWFKSGELNNTIMDYESKEKITELALEKTSVRLNNPGDVLIAMYGATIGKTGILQVVGTTNQAVCACTPFSCITSLFLHLLLKGLKDTFINQGEGGAQPNISKVKIRTQVFGLPPLEEQKEIVNVVETLFKEVEQLEQLTVKRIGLKEDFVTSALHQLTTNNAKQEWTYLQEHFKSFFNETTNIKKLRETVLQLAVQGKLTADWRSCHPEFAEGSHHASQLLKRIQEEKAQLIKDKKIKKEKVLPPITKDEIPYELPPAGGWVWCRMGSVTDIQRGSSPRPKGDPLYFSDKKTKNHWISIKDISKYSKNNILLDTEEYLTELGTKFSRYVKKNELIVAVSGSTTGKCCLTGIDGYFYDGLAMVRIIGNSIDHQFHLMYYLQLYNHMNDAKFGAAFPNINTKFLSEMLFPFPPLEEQKAIVDKVNALMGLCDALEQEVQQSQKHSEMLMQSVLREVFEIKEELCV
ncbi:restriction endonuclease subunit S [Hwangdonia lutea]|uniref:Restriction endonuclease subunit S n=1 Tax=Hwangdonia lutea TaxID=3075823 RepID=A0AA97HPZ7_9FLAO|nr:restriction endonuclease subunit S [Hwangdonia sp. SCSIO 19198]WOD43172.1 restriction endonuclease subunit S [Hwangdonia sp. SCSIO 19198]